MASLYTNELLPTTSEEAIREFRERYLAVLSAAPAPSWADRFKQQVNAPRVTYPMGVLATKFFETKEQSGTFKTMEERSTDLRVVEYDAGHEAKMIDLATNVFAYRRWNQAPANFAVAEQRHICRELAALLEAGTSATTDYDGVNFFATTHLSNPTDSGSAQFSNYQSSGTDPASITNLRVEMTSMAGVLDVNGDKLGVEPDEVWLPTGKFYAVAHLLSQNFLATGETNPLAGKLRPVHVSELTDVNDWYLVDSKLLAMGLDPLVAASYKPSDSLGLRFWDESSDFFKDTSKIKVSAHIWTGFKLLFPHAIRKVVGA